jgi:hypothetical protein
MKINAKQELIIKLSDINLIKCGKFETLYPIPSRYGFLKVGYSEKELADFLNNLDFEYDNGFGSQELDGIIWLKDGTWLSRWEYDGSEGWTHMECPKIPEVLATGIDMTYENVFEWIPWKDSDD